MKSLARFDGWLMVDNRASGGGLVETKTYTCSHCEGIVVINPERTRERGYCRGCDRYICDNCTAIRAQTLKCRPMQQVIDEILTAAESSNIIKEH